MQHLLLLHGAIGAKDQLQMLATNLTDGYTVHTLNFSGHGGEPFPENEFSISRFANEVSAYMDENSIPKADIFGYSMGGYVAMYLAKLHPQRVGRVATLATKFHWDEQTAEKECKMLDAEKIAAKIPAFASTLSKRHSPNNWKEVLSRTVEMLTGLGKDNTLKPDDYSSIEIPALILLGDSDKMVSLDETVTVYKALPNAQMGMLPNTQHPIEQVNMDALQYFLRSFFRD